MGGVYSPVGIEIIIPVGVEGSVGAGEDEADAIRSVVLAQDLDEVRDMRVRDMPILLDGREGERTGDRSLR